MKNLIYIFICLLSVSCVREKQPNSIKQQINDTISKTVKIDSIDYAIQPNSVNEIKNRHAAIDGLLKNGKLDSVALKYNCYNEKSGTITYYSVNEKLVLIKHLYNEYDHHSATDLYFVAGQKMFFTYFNRLSWSFISKPGKDGATKDDITEQRTYILNDKPVQCLEKKFSVYAKATNNPLPENVPNKEIDCKTIKPLLLKFNKLLKFKNGPKSTCFED